MTDRAVYIGFDPREAAAYAVTRQSLIEKMSTPVPVYPLILSELQARGLYTRPTERVGEQLVDVLSRRPDYGGWLSTEFAISRFLVPHLKSTGFAVFMDCDMLSRVDINKVFDWCEKAGGDVALWCVKHDHRPKNTVKMDGCVQTVYDRKNWSSFCVWRCDHPAHQALTLEAINRLPGRDLHRFCWLDDAEIGALDTCWNWLAGHSDSEIDPCVVHWTEGGPWLPEYRDVPYADEYFAVQARWARQPL